MDFNLYLDDVTDQPLSSSVERTGEPRNALIRRAVAEWLQRHDKPEWPDAVLNFHGGPSDLSRIGSATRPGFIA